MAPYEILAVRYATHDRRGAENFLFPDDLGSDLHDVSMPLDYFVWVVRSPERVLLVDTGFDRPAAERRGRKLLVHPADALRALGHAPEEIRDVVITHLHYDHAGNLAAFPNARFHVQDSEMAFATGRCMCHPRMRFPFDVEDVVSMVRRLFEGRVVFTEGDAELFPGISVHRVPGHTNGLQCVRVATERGPVVLASDATHLYANIELNNPFPIITNLPQSFESWRRLAELACSAERVIPGHDPAVLRLYPRMPLQDLDVAQLHLGPLAESTAASART
jgi:glyoxylase-like metal-dependent hydrolase (beta-lactamase superfamily II)